MLCAQAWKPGSQHAGENRLTTKPSNKAPTRPRQGLGAGGGDLPSSQHPRETQKQEQVGFPEDDGAAGGRLGQLPPAVGSPGPPVCTRTAQHPTQEAAGQTKAGADSVWLSNAVRPECTYVHREVRD